MENLDRTKLGNLQNKVSYNEYVYFCENVKNSFSLKGKVGSCV